MKIKLSINYSTRWGESVHVAMTYHYRGGRRQTQDWAMATDNGETWTLERAVVESRQRSIVAFSYFYVIEDSAGNRLRHEWHRVPRLYPFDPTKDYVMPDIWRDIPLQYHLMSLAHQTIASNVDSTQPHETNIPMFRRTIVFRVLAPQIGKGQVLGICGSHPSLGSWNPARYLRMVPCGECEWTLSVNVDNIHEPLEYKYVVVDDRTGRLTQWEEGINRTTMGLMPRDGEVVVLYGEPLRVCEKPWRTAGVAVPLFALRSERSAGTGDFADLPKLVDWAAKTGLTMIQLLPVFDTTTSGTWNDSHPYNTISLHALHPHYIALDMLPEPHSETFRNTMRRRCRELNALSYSDYEAVGRMKAEYVRTVFDESGEAVLRSREFTTFREQNSDWLRPYAAFCALRDHFHTARTADWHQYASYDPQTLARLYHDNTSFRHDCDLAMYTQYQLDRQLRSAAQYARSRGVSLCGDLPASLFRDSAVTWSRPELFHMDMKLGTPPTNTEPTGQDWGMPPMDWYPDNGKQVSGYLRSVLSRMERFFDAVRIDHIVSYFRTWEIPCRFTQPVMGHFSPSLPLTADDIRHAGLEFRRELFTQPFIDDNIISEIFGIHSAYVKQHYLDRKPYNLYALRSNVDTQRKVADLFRELTDENSLWIRDGLMRLCANVLFIEDDYRSGTYHPRFHAYKEPVFRILSTAERDKFMALYNNYYYERHEALWERLADSKLDSVLADTRLLVCGEDLGLMPRLARDVLDRHRILTLEVQAMPKHDTEGFAHLEAYPYRSIAMPTTHDMAPLRLWWEENERQTQLFWNNMLQKTGRAPRHMSPTVVAEVLDRHFYCPSMICMVAIQDLLAVDPSFNRADLRSTRINAPFDPYNRWEYRMKASLDDLLSADQFNRRLLTIVERSRRTGESSLR